jgi:hypothetical protein
MTEIWLSSSVQPILMETQPTDSSNDQAETNEVSTVTGQHLSVQHVLQKCKVSISDALLDEIREADNNGQGHTVLDEDADMELDEDLVGTDRPHRCPPIADLSQSSTSDMTLRPVRPRR